jgi:hypothetical protein
MIPSGIEPQKARIKVDGKMELHTTTVRTHDERKLTVM